MKVRMAVEQLNKDAFIEQVMRKYHFSTEEKEALQQVYEKVRTYMAPYESIGSTHGCGAFRFSMQNSRRLWR